MTSGTTAETANLRPTRLLAFAAAAEGVGDSLCRALLPVVAVSALGAGTAVVGLINSLGLLAFLVLSVPFGALVDRWSTPGRFMAVSTATRIIAVLAMAVAWSTGGMSTGAALSALITLALITGVADVAYTTGQGVLVPRLVPPELIRDAFGRVQSGAQTGGAAGPPLLAGVLLVAAAPAAWLCGAAAYLASLIIQLRIRPRPKALPGTGRRRPLSSAPSGFAHLRRQPLLRNITLANMFTNATIMAANTLVPVLALNDLGVAPAVYVVIGSSGALLGIAGAASAPALTARFGLRATRLAVSSAVLGGIALVLLSGTAADVLPGPPELWLGIHSGVTGFGMSVAMVSGADLAPRLVPPDVLGSVLGAQRTVVLGVMPATALLVGTAGSALGTPAAVAIWCGLAACAFLSCLVLAEPPAAK